MRIGAAERRAYWKGMAAGALFDAVIAAALAWFLKSDTSWLVTAAVIWLIIQVADLALSLLRWMRMLVAWRMGMFASAREGFRAALKENDLPKPEPYEESVDDYLAVAAMREGADPKVRVAAATLLGFRIGMKSFAGSTRSIILTQLHEKGLEDYRRE